MMTMTKVVAATAALFVCAQPCAAAEFGDNFARSGQRTAAFAGVDIRLPLGQRPAAKPTARLQLSSAYYTREQSGGFVQTRRTQGIEFGAGKAGKATLFVAGQDVAEMRKRQNLSGTTTTLLIVGGVLLALVVIAAASSPPQIFDE